MRESVSRPPVVNRAWSHLAWMRLAGGLIAAGALMLVAKGVLLIVTDNDRSLVPWFGLFTSAGLATAVFALKRSISRFRSFAPVGMGFAMIGVAGSLVAVGYLITGTIPESDGASTAVGASYVILAVGVYLSLPAIGIVVAKNRLLTGRWRWLPLGLAAAQFPIFIVAGAIGDGVGSENLTDGLGLALTGAAWTLLGYALTRTGATGMAAFHSR